MLNARMFCRFDERILWMVKDEWNWNQEAVGWGTIWNVPRQQRQQGKGHPVEFPLEIPSRCIRATTTVDDLVLDHYMGGGTTGVACIQLGRRFIGIEKERKYFDIAVYRIREAIAEKEAKNRAAEKARTNGKVRL